MRIATGLALAVVLVGCGGLTKEQRAANTAALKKLPPGTVLTEAQLATVDQDSTVVCENEKGTGSHIPHRVCRTLRRTNEQADHVRDSMPQTNFSSYDATVSAVRATGD
jgi:hypothetical protein